MQIAHATYLELIHVECRVNHRPVPLPLVAVGEHEPLAEQAGDVRIPDVLWVQPVAVEEHLLHHVHVGDAQVRLRPEPVKESAHIVRTGR